MPVADGGRVSSPAGAANAAAGDSRPPAAPAPRAKAEKPKCDPKLVAAARELRDRWLEQVNADPAMLIAAGKYDVGKPPPQHSPGIPGEGVKAMLPAA